MNHKTLQLIAAVPGIPMLLNGVGFVLDPGQVAMSLGMPLLEGLGRSTQIGDIGAFFLTCAWCVFYGSYRSSSSWLGAGALLLGLAAVCACSPLACTMPRLRRYLLLLKWCWQPG